MHKRPGEGDSPTPAARQLVHHFVSRDLEIRYRLVDALFDVPAVVRIDLGVQLLELPQALLVEIQRRSLLVLAKQSFDVCQPGPDHVTDRQIHRLGQALVELADNEVAVAHDLALVMLEFPGDQFQRRRLAGAVAANQAHALPGLDCQVGFAQDDQFTERERDFVETD